MQFGKNILLLAVVAAFARNVLTTAAVCPGCSQNLDGQELEVVVREAKDLLKAVAMEIHHATFQVCKI